MVVEYIRAKCHSLSCMRGDGAPGALGTTPVTCLAALNWRSLHSRRNSIKC